MQNDLPGWGMQRFFFFSYETHGFGFRGSERKKQLGMTGREAQKKKKAEGRGGHEGLIQRDSSVLIAAVKC